MHFDLVHEVGNRARWKTTNVMTRASAVFMADEISAIGGVLGVQVNARTGSVTATFESAAAKQAVARYLVSLETKPVILRRPKSDPLVEISQADMPQAARRAAGLFDKAGRIWTRAVCTMPVVQAAREPKSFQSRDSEDQDAALDFTPLVRWVTVRPLMPLIVNGINAILGAIPYVIDGIKALFKGKLTVEVLDAAAITVSLLRRDFRTAGIVILLLGIDSRKKNSKRSRTDTMVILSIDKKNKRLVMTSVLRDTYVTIPGVGRNRLNAANVFGGQKLLFKTFEKNFDIHLDKYVQIDFYNFIKLVDAVGGVDMKLSAAEIKVMNKTYIPYIAKSLKKDKNANLIKQNSSGQYHLNGIQALAYSRVRYVGTDFARTERQRKVMTQIIKKAKKLSVSEINDLADIVLPMITTNLSKSEVMSMLLNAKEYLNYSIVNGRMPINGSYKYMTIRGASVLGVNFDKNKKYWYKLVYGKN